MNNRQLIKSTMKKRAYQKGMHLHSQRFASFDQRQAALRDIFINYIKNPLVKIRELPKRVVDNALQEYYQISVDELTVIITEHIRKAQIDAHVQTFREGFETREKELILSDGYEPPQTEKELRAHLHEDDFIKGYFFRQQHPQRWNKRIEKQVVEREFREWNDLIDQGYVKTNLIDTLKSLNPVTIIKHMIHAVQKHGIKVALPIVLAETLQHSIPLWASKFLGPKTALIVSQIPIVEALTPAYLKWVSKSGNDPSEYLEWYESQYGDVDDVLDRNGKPIRLKDNQL
jgi:hypothetical protein